MYVLEKTKVKYNPAPWAKDYEERIGTLKKAKSNHKKTVAFVYDKFDSSTFRYRGYNTSETLESSQNWGGSYFQLADLNNLSEDIEYINVLVMIRIAWDEEVDEFLSLAKAQNIKIVYDIDDLIYDSKYLGSIQRAIGIKEREYIWWVGNTNRNAMLVDMCDACITTNEYMAGHIREDSGKGCYVIHNYLNTTQEIVSDEYFEQKLNKVPEGDFVIGYFSGSNTHLLDLMVALPHIIKLMEEYDNIRLRIVGYMEFPDEYKSWVEKKRIEFVPFQTFVGLQYEQSLVDVNIVPLVNNTFSNCKSELKYFETAIVGTITCATPTFAYSEAIKDGENGYLCENDDWYEKLKNIYLNGVTNEKKQFIRDEALKEYANLNQVELLESVFNSIIEDKADMGKEEKICQLQARNELLTSKQKVLGKELLGIVDQYIEAQIQFIGQMEEKDLQLRKSQLEAILLKAKLSYRKPKMHMIKERFFHKGENPEEKRAQRTQELLKKDPDYWKLVYDPKCYKYENSDLAEVFAGDDEKLLEHFICYGMDEGRKCIDSWDLIEYMTDHPELYEILGDDKREYYIHYIENAQK